MQPVIAIVGLGYVGLPLAVALSEHFQVIGYDISSDRVDSLKKGRDTTGEVESGRLSSNQFLTFTSDIDGIGGANTFIVTVPTPVDQFNVPDLTALKQASATIGRLLKPRATVIFESTVYPGVTEDICAPILEEISGLKVTKDFWIGYSPERINPGDKTRSLQDIKKVVAGCCEGSLAFLCELYGKVVSAGVHAVSSIRVAEMAKVIENTQRDVNIALINEISQICRLENINTNEVLDAAATKWNFINFRPGLVGGHCIGVDPYYLTHKCNQLNYNSQMIIAGRRINDSMPEFVARELAKKVLGSYSDAEEKSALLLGLTFKENCPDVRNSKSLGLALELEKYNIKVTLHDPLIKREELPKDSRSRFNSKLIASSYDLIVIAVGHREYCQLPSKYFRQLGRPGSIFADLKGIFPAAESDFQL